MYSPVKDRVRDAPPEFMGDDQVYEYGKLKRKEKPVLVYYEEIKTRVK
jgi:hypothetical protein